MPFFSIIIPTFNSALSIYNAIESVLNQSFLDFEILVIDGLSTDDTIKIVKGYSDKRIEIFTEQDSGVYDAMNKGLKLAKGNWIYFLGSDDSFYNNEVLRDVHNLILSYKRLFFYGNVLIRGDASWAKNGELYDGIFNLQKLLNKNICHQSIFYNRFSVIHNKIEFDKKYPICADWDFNLHCWAVNEFIYMPITVANFNAGGISSNQNISDNFYTDKINKYVKYFNYPSYFSLRKLFGRDQLRVLAFMRRYKVQLYFDKLFSRLFNTI